jgi:hypothetical protein
MTLSLTSPGRAFDDFNRANGAIGANWTKEYAAGGDLSIAGNKAVSSAQDNVWSFNPFGSANTDQFVSMVVYSSVNYAYKCLARCGGTNGVGAGYQVLLSGLGSLSVWNLAVGTQMGSTQTVSSVTSIGIRVTGSGATTKVSAFYNGSIHASLTDLTAATYTNAGKAGAYTVGANSSIDNFESLSRANVLVTSLPTGYYARLTDGTNVVDAAESSGTATITPSTAQGFGPWTLRIYNANPTTTGVQQGADQTGVYGGDSWAGSGFVTTQALAGSASGLGALTSVLALLRPLTGVSTGAGTEAATLAQLVSLSANATGAGTEAAALAEIQALTAAANGAGSLAAVFAEVAQLAASATGTGNEAATLTQIASLAATATGLGSETVTLAQLTALAASATGTGTQTAIIASLLLLAAHATGTGALTATMNELQALAASSTGVATVTAVQGSYTVLLNAAALGSGSASATLTGLRQIAAQAIGVGNAQATLAALQALVASTAGVGTEAATVTGVAALGAAAATGNATATATLNQLASLAAAATGAGAVTAGLAAMLAMSGSAMGTASVTADMNALLDLGAAIAAGNGGMTAALAKVTSLAARATGTGSEVAVIAQLDFTHGALAYNARLAIAEQSRATLGVLPSADAPSLTLQAVADTTARMSYGAEPVHVILEAGE